ncbi:hypothetical protein MMC17_010238 [Xylographa soralifera]|nr:hypothetical protein [Xylographa soralifera]
MPLGVIWASSFLCLFALIFAADKMGYFSRKNHFPVEGRTVLITGGSQGTGKSIGCMLAKKGANVVIVARSVGKLEEAIKSISACAKDPSTQRFHHISADLMLASEAPRILKDVTEWNKGSPLDIVFCCAGSCHPTLFIETPVEKLRQQMDSNYFSAAYIAHATLTLWLKPSSSSNPTSEASAKNLMSREPRHLIFTSSVCGLFNVAGYSPYSPSKTALRSLSDSLSMEMQLYASADFPPVRIHTIFPGTIFTESYVEENKIKPAITKKLEEDDGGQTPDQVAEKSIQALEKGEELIATAWLGRALMCGVLGGSTRNGWPIIDTALSWVMSILMIFVRRDMDSKVRNWGKVHGTSGGAGS